jgi:ribosomal protein L12E/L44/L45/RPP1/RPP2
MATFVINPLTNRSIQVGKPLWHDLVKRGVLEDSPEGKHPKVVYQITGNETELELEQIRQELGDKNGNYHVARGRGHRLNDKLVKRYKQPKSQFIVNKVVQAGVKAVQKYPKAKASSNWEDDLTSFINKELVNLNIGDQISSKYKTVATNESSSEQESESESEIEDEETPEESEEEESEEESEDNED